MSTLTIQLPESLKNTIEKLAAREGYSVSQFLASAAGEKLAVVLTIDYLRREAAAGRREDFEKYLAAVRTCRRCPAMNSDFNGSLREVPDIAPPDYDRLPEGY